MVDIYFAGDIRPEYNFIGYKSIVLIYDNNYNYLKFISSENNITH